MLPKRHQGNNQNINQLMICTLDSTDGLFYAELLKNNSNRAPKRAPKYCKSSLWINQRKEL